MAYFFSILSILSYGLSRLLGHLTRIFSGEAYVPLEWSAYGTVTCLTYERWDLP